jgi:AcrR family transcriptional regulator
VSETASAEVSRRGRPRSEAARVAILDAADALLLARGLGAVSMEAIAERAGVGKATIYRWWPTKEALALDALYYEWAAASDPGSDTGSLKGDLVALLKPWVRRVGSRPYARVLAALIEEARTDPKFGEEYLDRLVRPRRAQATGVFTRAIDRGEIRADLNIDVALDLIYGALYHRLLHGHAPLNDRFVTQVVEMAVDGMHAVAQDGGK